MVRHIKGTSIRTVDGEATLNITLDINIKINADGSLSVGTSNVQTQRVNEEIDEFERPIPSFNNTKFKFGKEE